MEKRSHFEALENLSKDLFSTLAEVENLKKYLQDLMEENTALRLENDKLRERLDQLQSPAEVKPRNQGISNLQKIYEDDFHVCNVFYGQRRHDGEDCAWCLELLYRD
ncbi:DNA replication initiation control protein YabA [Streptococcus ovuberis]|uniref:Replication initiation control protein YabA n=1 Tax=Streptococcus ovuberis TaxID=1936207 RepID=A0A7X6MWC6_9STRE|nr:DNA replication initiation control protein YabA [Streptococcus ovuberis]NKZ19602.1 DNA replication initiation control protein YabA [Streptococcus ovuberis]